MFNSDETSMNLFTAFASWSFSVEGTSSVNQTELLLTRPSPYAVYSALQGVGLVLTDNRHQPINFQPYGHNTQVVTCLGLMKWVQDVFMVAHCVQTGGIYNLKSLIMKFHCSQTFMY